MMTAAEVTGDFHGGDRRGRQVPAGAGGYGCAIH